MNEPHGPDEHRGKAVTRMKLWIRKGEPESELDLSNCGLTSLPMLPAAVRMLCLRRNRLSVLPNDLPRELRVIDVDVNELTELPATLPGALQKLFVGGNRLSTLPAGLPQGLQQIDVSRNRLTTLPAGLPAGLRSLCASDNQLTSLPADLPAGLQKLYVAGNQLARLTVGWRAGLLAIDVSFNQLEDWPDDLPATLEQLDVRQNRLTSLPERIGELPSTCQVLVDGNPFAEALLLRLYALTSAASYSGPEIIFSRATLTRDAVARPLAEAARDWLGELSGDAVHAWQANQGEPGALAFSLFLDRLRGTVNYGNTAFRADVAAWLPGLVQPGKAAIRGRCFELAQQALETCEDRVSLTLNQMRMLSMATDVEAGRHDHDIPGLIALARGLFRLDALEKIARKKAASLWLADDVEVYLSYQVKLRERLSLPVSTLDMRYFDASFITAQDLAHAETMIRKRERGGFADFLSLDWQPWQAVMRRLGGGGYRQALAAKEQGKAQRFQVELDGRLRDLGLEADDDARREMGAVVLREINRDIHGGLTEAFLASRGLPSLREAAGV